VTVVEIIYFLEEIETDKGSALHIAANRVFAGSLAALRWSSLGHPRKDLTTTLGATPAIVGIIEGIAEGLGRLGHSFGLHRAMDTLGAVVGITIAYFLFTTTKGQYTKIVLLSMIPGIIAGNRLSERAFCPESKRITGMRQIQCARGSPG
jgi:hypothetical protein